MVPPSAIPAARLRAANDLPIRTDGSHVLYWMIAYRRTASNFALQRAVELAADLKRPLVVLEALRCDYPWASDRLHRFVIEGMAANARALTGTPAVYLPYVEPAPRVASGLLAALAADACVVVTDDYPAFFLPSMIAAAARRLPVRLEAVDSNGIMPMRASAQSFVTAYSFRAFLQRELRNHLSDWPSQIDWSAVPAQSDGSRRTVAGVVARWPMVDPAALDDPTSLSATLPIDHGVRPVAFAGGAPAGGRALGAFVERRLSRYVDDRNEPEVHGTSGLSPYLHFGHVSTHQVFDAVMTSERWTSRKLSNTGGGRRAGWWGVSEAAEAFLDQVVTWRELGFNMCATRPQDYASFGSLPTWARATLAKHADDRRTHVYTREEFEQARTGDPLWNAAERQLTRDGWMHNYLRMLWGKKILEWSASPEEALAHMIAIMDRHAVDGRDPNSYTGYLWTLGRYDRPWAPERPIFGTVRYMSSDNTLRKLHLKRYLQKYGPDGTLEF